MSQAAEILKDKNDWMIGENGTRVLSPSGADNGYSTPLPPQPPVVHTYHTSGLLPILLIPMNVVPEAVDEAIESIIKILEPSAAQQRYRYSANTFLSRVVRQCLSVKVFESDLHAMGCYLPDDPIRLTVLVGPANHFIDTWVGTLCERFKNFSDHSETSENLLYDVMTLSEDEDQTSEALPLIEHSLSHVSAVSGSGQNCVFFAIENVSVEIVANNLGDAHLLAFFDEFANMVGKDDLFRRSLTIVRAWWTYETSEYLNVSTKNYMPNAAICVLLISIFNQHHAIIFHPLQALSIFFAEYGDVDWNKYAVTIQGIVPFKPILETNQGEDVS